MRTVSCIKCSTEFLSWSMKAQKFLKPIVGEEGERGLRSEAIITI